MLVIVTIKINGEPAGDSHHAQTAEPIPINHLAAGVLHPQIIAAR